MYKYSKVDFIAYLYLKGFKAKTTEVIEGFTYFYFDNPQVEQLYSKWQFQTEPEVEFLQKYLTQRKEILKIVSPRRNN